MPGLHVALDVNAALIGTARTLSIEMVPYGSTPCIRESSRTRLSGGSYRMSPWNGRAGIHWSVGSAPCGTSWTVASYCSRIQWRTVSIWTSTGGRIRHVPAVSEGFATVWSGSESIMGPGDARGPRIATVDSTLQGPGRSAQATELAATSLAGRHRELPAEGRTEGGVAAESARVGDLPDGEGGPVGAAQPNPGQP